MLELGSQVAVGITRPLGAVLDVHSAATSAVGTLEVLAHAATGRTHSGKESHAHKTSDDAVSASTKAALRSKSTFSSSSSPTSATILADPTVPSADERPGLDIASQWANEHQPPTPEAVKARLAKLRPPVGAIKSLRSSDKSVQTKLRVSILAAEAVIGHGTKLSSATATSFWSRRWLRHRKQTADTRVRAEYLAA